MKIVMFTDAYWPRVNGVTVSVDSFARALIKAGHKVLIICAQYPAKHGGERPLMSGDNEADPLAPPTVRVPSMPIFLTNEDRLAKFHKWFWVFKQVELFDPDIIHINTEFVIAEFGFLYARVHNLPAIYTFHTMWEDYAESYFPFFPTPLVRFVIRGILKNILRRSYKVIVPSPQIETVVRKYKFKRETFSIPTGIDPRLFDHSKEEIDAFRLKMEDRYEDLKGKRILIFAGRVTKEKNVSFLLKMMPRLLQKHPEVALLVIGNGPDIEYFCGEAQEYGVEKNCVFTGYMDRDELALAYGMSDIFVFPSRTETQGLVTIEAMLSGIPVVAIGEMGTIMVMGGDNGGFMVKNDENEFLARVEQLLEDPELYAKKVEEAKEHAKPWSIDSIALRLAAAYQKSIDSYSAENGERLMPVWELVMDKNWWKANNRKFKRLTTDKWRDAALNFRKKNV